MRSLTSEKTKTAGEIESLHVFGAIIRAREAPLLGYLPQSLWKLSEFFSSTFMICLESTREVCIFWPQSDSTLGGRPFSWNLELI